MFHTARIKLTFWYVLIIMIISALFSVGVYRGLTYELKRSLKTQSFRYIPAPGTAGISIPISVLPEEVEQQIFNEVRHRIVFQLGLLNLGIMCLSAIAAYFLAGKTLKPIETMLDDQKRFVADASHELRTPLTSMKTEIEVALRGKTLPLKNAKELLQSNLEEVDKMQTLSNYLLALSKYEDDRASLPFEMLELSQIIEKAVSNVVIVAKDKEIEIKTELAPIRIEANKVSLVELFTILLDNALKYSHNKGQVVIRTKKSGKHVQIEIEDFGIGIKAGDIPYIFNRFYRADTSRSKKTIDGYGLGLSIAKSIVDMHRGKISVESIPNKGSVFAIILPQ